MHIIEALLMDLYDSHIALLLASRGARWDRHSELLLEEEQLRAEEELTLAEGTSALSELLPSDGETAQSSRALAMRCTREVPADTMTALASLIDEHRRATLIAERLLEAADEEQDTLVAAVAARLASEHAQAARTLDKLRRRVHARQNSARALAA